MTRSAIIPLCIFMLTAGCNSASYGLPESEKLSTKKVVQIAETVERRYPDLSLELRRKLVELVVRSLDNMVFVEGGEFEMGDFGWPYDDDPESMCDWPCGEDPSRMGHISPFGDDDFVHPVKLTSYFLSKFQVRLEEFDLFFISQKKEVFDATDRTKERIQHLYKPGLPAPVKHWQEAKNYCNWLGQLSDYPVDLPTEAQWEFAARNRGQYIAFPTDNGSLNYNRNFPHPDKTDTFPVDEFLPNSLGLYNLSGNATDWVNDWYERDYYHNSPVENPQGPTTGTQRIKRGSNYAEDPLMSASTVRRWADKPDQKGYYPGTSFRCAVQSANPL